MTSTKVSAAPGDLGHLFRHQAGRLVSTLTRIFGVHNLDLAEDVVQDALCRALEVWKFNGVPDDPAAWLHTAAKNRAIDVLRRERSARRFAPDLHVLFESEWTLVPKMKELFSEHEIEDDTLRMMFSCASPRISEEGQVALMLNLLCGFSVEEIAAAFLQSEAAMQKRLQRARRALAESGGLFEVAGEREINSRLHAVHRALYLLFNEGYHGAHPKQTVRSELCSEAMRLCTLLVDHPACGGTETRSGPVTRALLALMCLHAARLPGRVDPSGDLSLLEAQDRALWDKQLIDRGLRLLSESAAGDTLSTYHLEAAIAAEHVLSPSIERTNWRRIVELYDLLYAILPTPVVALNRAIAVSELEGPERGLEEVRNIGDNGRLFENYPFYEATLGELERRAERPLAACQHFERAIALSRADSERRVFEAKLVECKRALS